VGNIIARFIKGNIVFSLQHWQEILWSTFKNAGVVRKGKQQSDDLGGYGSAQSTPHNTVEIRARSYQKIVDSYASRERIHLFTDQVDLHQLFICG